MHRMRRKTDFGESVLINGQQWMHDEVKKLLSFIHHFCQAGQSFFFKSGIRMKDVDVDLGPNMRDYSPIKDDEHDPLMKDKIIPFFKEVRICLKFLNAFQQKYNCNI
jgi:hypothetical protein